MYHSTGLHREEVEELTRRVAAAAEVAGEEIGHPPSLGLFTSIRIALTYLRRNVVQVFMAEMSGCSQPTISRAISAVQPWIKVVLEPYIPVADELDPEQWYIVDGTLVPCWSWAYANDRLYSGKHQTTGMNLQVVCDIDGNLVLVSDAVDGRHHDVWALDDSGLLVAMDPSKWIGDKGYVGRGMVTPIKKPGGKNGRELLDWEKEFNTSVNKIRWVVERAIANLKTWRILHTDYRRPLNKFDETISTVIALHFWRMAAE